MSYDADAELAEKIVNKFFDNQQLKYAEKEEIKNKIAKGQMRSEDWVLLVENEILKEVEAKNGKKD